MSLTTNRIQIFPFVMSIPISNCLISDAKSLINIADKVGDKESTWHTPLSFGNQSVTFEFNLTQDSGWLYMALIQL